jgi:5-bromo-4-chloroindolyl phosphate hydrolysis protein
MEASSHTEREDRAARNQALFRAVNEKLEVMNEAFVQFNESFTIACECADVSCVEMLEIDPDEYQAVRAEPRHFAVLPGHIYSEVEVVVREGEGYVVVEKTDAAGEVAELLERDGEG